MNISPLSKKKCTEPYSKSVLYNSSLCINNKAKEKYRGVFEIQRSGDKTSSGEIDLDIRTHASPKVGQDQVSGGVSVPCRHATMPKTIRFKILYEKCIIIVSYLLDENGNVLSFNDLKERYNLNICFLTYMGIRRELFTAYPTLKNGVMHIKGISYIPNFVRLLTRDKKGSRTLYDLLVQKQKPIEKYEQ